MENILRYIDEHYMEDLSLSGLANEYFLAPTYLAKKFKDKTGQTVIQYLEKRRISSAKDLLIFSDRSISEIASMTGYNDSNYFARSFKKICGITPSEFRTKVRRKKTDNYFTPDED